MTIEEAVQDLETCAYQVGYWNKSYLELKEKLDKGYGVTPQGVDVAANEWLRQVQYLDKARAFLLSLFKGNL
jgi:hypothetical protein